MARPVRMTMVGTLGVLALAMTCLAARAAPAAGRAYELNDSHFHLTNYVQEGTDIHRFLVIMGDKVGRVALFGTDEVAPPDQETYRRVYRQYDPLRALLTPEAREKVRTGNYERLFDEASRRVRAWEAASIK